MSKNFDETVYASSPKEEWIREEIKEILCGTVDGWSNASCLANSSAVGFPGKISGQGALQPDSRVGGKNDSSCQICGRA